MRITFQTKDGNHIDILNPKGVVIGYLDIDGRCLHLPDETIVVSMEAKKVITWAASTLARKGYEVVL